DETGVLIDFVEARQALDGVVALLDHSDLNASAVLAGANPSAEHVARAIGQHLAGRIKRPELLESVSVEEEPGCWATFLVPGRK
ncbi:MAG: 6-pyruvoyl tetrahydropterin synthase family protein, partial [Phycisphaerae bacterium]